MEHANTGWAVKKEVPEKGTYAQRLKWRDRRVISCAHTWGESDEVGRISFEHRTLVLATAASLQLSTLPSPVPLRGLCIHTRPQPSFCLMRISVKSNLLVFLSSDSFILKYTAPLFQQGQYICFFGLIKKKRKSTKM
jgi:hypothetical protein